MGSSLPLGRCSELRRIGGGPPQMGTNNGGSGALEDDNVEDEDNKMGGSELSLLDNKDDLAGEVTRGEDNGMGPATAMFVVNA